MHEIAGLQLLWLGFCGGEKVEIVRACIRARCEFGFLNYLERLQQIGIRILEETRRKLMQQPSDILGRIGKYLSVCGITLAMQAHMLQC